MDRNRLRAQAKLRYKEMMKSTPKNKRPSFKQLFPQIKKILENGNSKSDIAAMTSQGGEATAASMNDVDLASIEQMMTGGGSIITAPEVGEDGIIQCEDFRVIEAEVVQEASKTGG